MSVSRLPDHYKKLDLRANDSTRNEFSTRGFRSYDNNPLIVGRLFNLLIARRGQNLTGFHRWILSCTEFQACEIAKVNKSNIRFWVSSSF